MKIAPPLVSTIAVCYNHEIYLEETLNSILSQTYKNIELIIIDDCSSDNSVNVINKWIKQNGVVCKFTFHKRNLGLCKTMNEALSYCTGKYIQMISCDDVMHKDKTSIQVEILEKSSVEVGFVCSNFSLISSESKVIKPTFLPEKFEFPSEPLKYILENNRILIHPASCLTKKSTYDVVGPYDENLLQEDFQFFVKVLMSFSILYVDKVLLKYRQLTTSLSQHPQYSVRLLSDYIRFVETIETQDSDLKKSFSIFKCRFYLYLNNTYIESKDTLNIRQTLLKIDKFLNENSYLSRTDFNYQLRQVVAQNKYDLFWILKNISLKSTISLKFFIYLMLPKTIIEIIKSKFSKLNVNLNV